MKLHELNFSKCIFSKVRLALFVFAFGLSCAKKPEDLLNGNSVKYLYVASGVCYAGAGNTTPTATTSSNLVYRINLSTGQRDNLLADYFATGMNAGDSPVGVANLSTDQIYILVENATAGLRRIEKADKNYNTNRSLFTNQSGAGALSTTARYLSKTISGDLLIARTTGIPFLRSDQNFLPSTTALYYNPSAAPCATSNTGIMKTLPLSSLYGRTLFLHAAAGQNRFGILPPTSATACVTAGVQASPNANAYPSAAAYDPINSLVFVAYSGNSAVTTDINSIYVYPVTETSTTVAIGTGQKIYDASLFNSPYSFLLYGISEMTYDSTTKSLYVASAVSTATTVTNFKIEKFTIDHASIGVDNTKVLNRTAGDSFYPYGNDTKCISQMMIAD